MAFHINILLTRVLNLEVTRFNSNPYQWKASLPIALSIFIMKVNFITSLLTQAWLSSYAYSRGNVLEIQSPNAWSELNQNLILKVVQILVCIIGLLWLLYSDSIHLVCLFH